MTPSDQPDSTFPGQTPGLMRRIAFARTLAWLVLFFERLILAAFPVLCVAALFAATSWFGAFRLAPNWLANLMLLVFGAAILAALLPFRTFRLPEGPEAEARVELASGLDHQAIRALSDHPAGRNDATASALWKAHQRQLAGRIKALHVGEISPDIARRDPYALRAAAVLALVVGWGFSFGPWGGRLADAFVPRPEPVAVAASQRIDAWVTPPVYTSRPPVYLSANADGQPTDVKVPQFSVLTIRLADGSAPPSVRTIDGKTIELVPDKPATATPADPAAAAQPASSQSAMTSYTTELTSDGMLDLGGRIFRFALVPDSPPTIDFAKEPAATVNGALEITFKAKDDYAIKEARADIVPLEEAADAVPLFELPEYRLDIPAHGKGEIKSTTSRDLTEHPLSGRKVRITLVATDARGQEGRSPSRDIILPARPFTQELAASIAEQRQIFSLDVNRIGRALELNDASTLRPEETAPVLGHYLAVKSAANRLKLAYDAETLRAASDYFWEVARGIEDGDLADAEKRLKDAQKNLSDALKNGASDAEIQKLMAELRKAMDEYLKELAKRSQPGDQQNSQMASKVLRSQDLQKMLDQLENLARSGARDQAQQLLNDMQRMMNNLNTARPNQNNQQNNPMREQVDKLGRIIEEQQKLMEETHRLEQALRDRQQRGDPGEDQMAPGEDPFGEDGMNEDVPEPGEQADPGSRDPAPSPESTMTAEQLKEALKALKERQQELEKGLGELQKKLSELGAKPMPGFGEGKKAMKDAAGDLGRSDGERAVDNQGKALEALRNGARQMMQAMMQGQGQQQGNQQGGQQGQQGRDPLGRQTSQNGEDVEGDVKVPDEIDIQRAREILEEIRRRLSDGNGSTIERDYLERLLDLGRQANPLSSTP